MAVGSRPDDEAPRRIAPQRGWGPTLNFCRICCRSRGSRHEADVSRADHYRPMVDWRNGFHSPLPARLPSNGSKSPVGQVIGGLKPGATGCASRLRRDVLGQQAAPWQRLGGQRSPGQPPSPAPSTPDGSGLHAGPRVADSGAYVGPNEHGLVTDFEGAGCWRCLQRRGGGFQPITASALHGASVSAAIRKSAKAETFAGRARAVGVTK